MRRTILTFALSLMLTSSLSAQTGSLGGTVRHAETGEPLEGANVVIQKTIYGSSTNRQGRYQIKNIPAGNYDVTASHLGFQSRTRSVNISPGKSDTLNFRLARTPVRLGEVRVSSVKADRSLRDVSLPMEIVAAQELEKSSEASLSDYLGKEPGITLARDGIWGTHISIRGLNRQNIVKLVDGNRIETATNLAAGMSLIDVSDIQRVEVIKAGASSLYGSGATGGVVNVITRQPDYGENLFANGKLSGSYRTVNGQIKNHVGMSAGSERWKARLSGTFRDAGDTRTPEGTLNNSQYRDYNISANIGVKPAENHELTLDYQQFYAEDVGIPGGAPFPGEATARYPETSRQMFSAEYSLKNLFEYLPELSVKYFHQFIGREVEIDVNPAVTSNPQADHTTNGVQIQSNWMPGGSHTLSAGIDIWQRDYAGSRTRTIRRPGVTRIIGDKPVPDSDYRSSGLYAQDEFSVLEGKLAVTLGGRIDQIRVTNQAVTNPEYIVVDGTRNDNPPVDSLASFGANEDYDLSWSGNLGLIYELSPDLDLTFNGAKTFRSPTLEERFQYINLGGAIYLGDPGLNPEKGTYLDLGFRLWKPKLNLRGSVYLNAFRDLVVDKAVVADSLYRSSNVGEARLHGLDLSAEYNVYRDLVLYGSVSYVRGRDTGSDTDLPEIPPLNARAGLRAGFLEYLNADVSATLYDEQEHTAPGESETPGYTYFDAYINSDPFELGAFKLRLFAGIENLTDKAYRSHLSTYRGMNRLEPGRNFFLRTSVEW